MSEESIASTSSTSNGGILESESVEMAVYKKEACKAVTFHLVYNKDDFETENTIRFSPEMAHQIFGESESIFGYRHLSVIINFLHNSCRCYVDIESSGKINSKTMKADDIMKSLNPWLPANYTVSYEEFLGWTENEEHDKMFGEVIKTFSDNSVMQRFNDEKIKATYKITRSDIDNEEFKELHARFETYIVWFIDAANFIDLDDDRWLIFYVYEEFEHPVKKTIYRSPIAFCTVYKFYAYPVNIRARISQFFVLPPHQKRGVGTVFYETVVRTLRAMDSVIDVTVEGPTAAFLKIRDLEDCGVVHRELVERNLNYFATSSKTIFELGRKKKIGRRQIQRVYDILGLYYASKKGPVEYNKVLDNIRNRISDKNENESRPSKRFAHLGGVGGGLEKDKKALIEAEYKRHCEDIEPSVKYLEAKLEGWLQKNGVSG